ncbi:cytochrome c oxidase assembly protein COX20, mitochondrial isoform X2 [Phyllostomus discolor]|uniref:Cytochrome c oxidase assembly protein COX20, mitochondrial n=1 Tax=Phyllostomus discolor TaxID=89673 RepID=A0A7E6CY09_9CHIR|nr:cytochrome c oxidase assembly protein COX20, mitochondrial isoform X2 [Phyllostomus discolor]
MAAAPEPGEPEKGKPFKLLGILDVENIPCARDSILYGSLGSVVAGLGHFLLTSSTVGIIMQSKGSGKESPEKELKIRFYMKVPTLILKENKATAATEQGRAEKPTYNSLLWV